jgi:hypothetical protein
MKCVGQKMSCRRLISGTPRPFHVDHLKLWRVSELPPQKVRETKPPRSPGAFPPFPPSFTSRSGTIRRLKYKTRNQISSSVLASDTRSDGVDGPAFELDLPERPAPAVNPQLATCGVSAFLRGVAVARDQMRLIGGNFDVAYLNSDILG